MTTGPLPDPPGLLGDYIVLGTLGQGGMGVVYLGRARNGSQVAIKVIRNRLVGDPAALRRFRREVQLARMVPRHCTAPVIDADLDHDPPYLVTEYVKGPTLEAAVTEDPLTPSTLHGVAIAVADALTEIHRVGVVHGDLTPRNVLLSPSGPRVIDFGIARVPTQAAGSSANQIIGTPAFMAPEHFDPSAPVTDAADVFAWGSVMAFAGTGRKPFGDGPPMAVGRQIVEQRPNLEGLDPILREIVEAAMQKDPAERPSAATLRERLTAAARTADRAEQRTLVVRDVLRTAREHSDPPLFTPAHRWPEAPPPRSFPIVPTAITVVGLVLFTAGVWFHQPGRLGPVVNNVTRYFFGYGVYLVPVVAAAWAFALLQRRSTPPLWLVAKAVVRDPSRGVVLRALWSTTATAVRSVRAGPLAVLLGSLGLLHVVRGTSSPPPVDAAFELQRSGGVVGALFPDFLVYVMTTLPAVALLALWLLYGMITTTQQVDRRWGRRAAAAALAACLLVAIVPVLYLKDHRYEYWVKFGSNDQVAVYRGLSTQRREPVRTTSVTRATVPTALQQQLDQGVPAESREDALQLASRLPVAHRQPTFVPGYDDQGRRLVAGTCLTGAEQGSPVIACQKLHSAEVSATLATPYRVFPGTSALQAFAELACRTAFESYVGIPPEGSTLGYVSVQPDADAWEKPDGRAIACLVQPGLVSEMTGSIRGSRQIVADDFSDDSHWYTDENDNCIIEYSDAALQLQKRENGTFCVSTPEEESVEPRLVQDAQISVNVTTDTDVPTNGRVGLVCRWVSDRELYALGVDGNGRYRIAKVRNGKWITLRFREGKGAVKLRPAEPIRLRASCHGGEGGKPVKLALWAGKQLLATAEDDSKSKLRLGTIGVIVEASRATSFHAAFDDLVTAAPTSP